MGRFVVFALMVLAVVGIGAYLRRVWRRRPVLAATPPADPVEARRQARLGRLRLAQRVGLAVPAVAVVVLVMGDAGLASALLGLWLLLAGGLAAIAAGLREPVARAALVRVLGGAALVGAGIGAAQIVAGAPAGLAALLGIGAAAGMVALFPPPVAPPAEALPAREAEARARAAAFRAAAHDVGEPTLRAQALALADRSEALLVRIGQGGVDRARSRKFLGVWLIGARDATAAFVRAEGHRDPTRAARYARLLDDLSTALTRLDTALREADRTRLDVEIEVLSERLAAEGLT